MVNNWMTLALEDKYVVKDNVKECLFRFAEDVVDNVVHNAIIFK